jgi:hypothetical protein
MENITTYRPNVLKDEVPVYEQPMRNLFQNNTIYVLGYGSLLASAGWNGRGLKHLPTASSLIECELDGFERGPYGCFGHTNFYGVIRNASKSINGVLCQITDLRDWVRLMFTEHIAGLHHYANYRVIDVTSHVKMETRLPEPYKVHCVCNRPVNKQKMSRTYPAAGYYDYVWRIVKQERSTAFQNRFLQTGGFKSNQGVRKFLAQK